MVSINMALFKDVRSIFGIFHGLRCLSFSILQVTLRSFSEKQKSQRIMGSQVPAGDPGRCIIELAFERTYVRQKCRASM